MKYVCRFALPIVCAGMLLLPAAAQSNSNASSSQSSASSSQTSSSQGKSSAARLTMADRQFLNEAAEGNKAEVELGQLAQQKASSDDVKKFGQRMVDDHTKAGQQVDQLASEKGVNVPDKLSAKDQATKARLEKLSGKQFDEAYMRDMVRDHAKDVSAFQREARTAKDSDVKSYAQNTVGTLQDHLKMAKQIAPKNPKATNSSTKGSS